uniref:Ig-like domain-containing protein n=1 Tax=Hucho hucho TaxID=62062 RepID=A0A4W5KEG4_9TELE
VSLPLTCDRGTYICSAQNSVGLDRAMVTLEVWSRPPRIQLPNHRDATVHQGGEVRLECRAQGVLVPLLSWVLPDRSVLTPDPNPNPALGTHPRVSIFPNGTLRILVAGPADRGLYRCVSSNTAGAGSLAVRLHVSSLPPAIQEPREERVTRPAGLPLYAQCSARGAPAPSIRWRTPDGTLLLPSQFLNGNLFVLPNATLLIRKLATKDSGSYECLATNAVGRDKRTVRVEVTGDGGGGEVVSMDKMTFSSINSKFDLPPSSPVIKVQQGGAVALNCGAKGDPVPTITWLSPMNRVLPVEGSGPVVVQQDGSLVIQGARGADGGNYTCRASNAAGESSKVMGVEVMVTPPSFTLNGAGGGINGADRQTAVVSGSHLSTCDLTEHTHTSFLPKETAKLSAENTVQLKTEVLIKDSAEKHQHPSSINKCQHKLYQALRTSAVKTHVMQYNTLSSVSQPVCLCEPLPP